jgi:DNA-binding NarL/FixJ family response regulator
MGIRRHAMSRSIRVVVIDDHEAVRAGLERVVSRSPDLELVAALPDDCGLLSLVGLERVDVVVLDYDLERGGGLSLCLRLKQRAEPPAVVIYSGYAGPALAFAATIAQADAVLNKAEPVEVLLGSIRRLAAGERLLGSPPTDLLEAAAARLPAEDLPIMALLGDGVDAGEIARALGVSLAEVARRGQRVVGRLQAGTKRPRSTTFPSLR